mgnify:CR=1 FL=1
MAGIGVQLNKIFGRRTITSSLYGVGFSFTYTIAPMLAVIGCLLAMFSYNRQTQKIVKFILRQEVRIMGRLKSRYLYKINK